MKMTKHYFLKLVIYILFPCFILVGCSSNISTEKDKYTEDIKSAETYSDEFLSEIEKFTGTMNETVNSYKSNCVKNATSAECGKVIYRGETKILVLIFDESGNRLAEDYYDMTVSKSEFDTINVGSTRSDVKSIDPNGKYIERVYGRNDIPILSCHATTDGYYITITYDMNDVVADIEIDSI